MGQKLYEKVVQLRHTVNMLINIILIIDKTKNTTGPETKINSGPTPDPKPLGKDISKAIQSRSL